ncbi:hypothetical protein BESB_054460 [Besnoitia besnoiti]|uniref:Uncharacterized protein n=1 Tax=Besnoitia besnoiti TaxID=94643 RepID=A0A2A9MCS4_BESBE|nr:hypothetical protein BESB_054460 [Besnoitia besnoiti]PFH35795.1 hypothetical protein BESB_054460 [Besnoitia besnoiti]
MFPQKLVQLGVAVTSGIAGGWLAYKPWLEKRMEENEALRAARSQRLQEPQKDSKADPSACSDVPKKPEYGDN